MSTAINTLARDIDSSNDDTYAHYADAVEITQAVVLGTLVTALCGKTWVPSRAPEGYPVCAQCKRIYEQLS